MMASTITSSDLSDLPCDCCGARSEQLMFQKNGVLTQYPFRLVTCGNCGFLYINPRLTEQAITALYDKAYYHGEGFDSYVDYVADYEKQTDQEKVFHSAAMSRQICRAMPGGTIEGLKILDFGCGLGDLMRHLTSLGAIVEGFEVSPFARAFAQRHGFTVYSSPDEIPGGQYDLVVSIEVLEHLYRPSLGFAQISAALKPGGRFIYSTYDIDIFLLKRKLGRATDDPYILPEGHINFFGRNTASRFLRQSGFSRLAPPVCLHEEGMKAAAKQLAKRLLGLTLPSAIK